MSFEVYFLCPNCNGLTNGTGCGDTPDDEITCKSCGKKYPSKRIGKLDPHSNKEERRLYADKYNFNVLLDEQS